MFILGLSNVIDYIEVNKETKSAEKETKSSDKETKK